MSFEKSKIKLNNPNLNQEFDNLYHLGFLSNSKELFEIFSDVKFVCMGGSGHRMLLAANMCRSALDGIAGIDTTEELKNLCTTDRYVCYKVGPVLFVNHGIGISSLTVVLHEIIKALYYAKAPMVCLIRVGTSGGIGVKAGTVVLTDESMDGLFNTYFEMPVLGKMVRLKCKYDANINNKLKECRLPTDNFDIIIGKTFSALDFYIGQARLDGFYCDFTLEDKLDFLKKLKNKGVCNIEMEALSIGAMAHQANIPAVVVCVTLVDRMQGDQLCIPTDVKTEWEQRPIKLVLEMIRRYLTEGAD